MAKRLILLVSMMIVVSSALAQEDALPVHGQPKWYTVAGSALTSGSDCLVRSASTGAVIGKLAPGYKFLAFGANSNWITLAMGNTVGYIPATAALAVYPVPDNTGEYRSGGKTLEDLGNAHKKRRDEAKNKPLAPSFYKPKESPGAGGAMGVAGDVPVEENHK